MPRVAASGLLIEALTARRVRIPLRRPLRSAHGTEPDRDVIIVTCRLEDGTDGWGECPTLHSAGYGAATTEQVWADLGAGRPPRPVLAGAIADAVLDARLRSEGRSLADALGATRASVPTTVVIDLDGGSDDAAAGAPSVKWKLTPDNVAGVRVACGASSASMRAVDANGSFRTFDAALRALEGLPLRYIEQPFAVGEDHLAAALAERITPTVVADESATSLEEVQRLAAMGALGGVSIKPSRLGGVAAAAAAATTTAALGIDVFVGGMWESGIGRAAAVALAACDAVTLPSDLGPPQRYLAVDLTEPLRSAAGATLVPRGPGIGVLVDVEALDHHTVATRALDAQPGEMSSGDSG